MSYTLVVQRMFVHKARFGLLFGEISVKQIFDKGNPGMSKNDRFE